MNGDFKIIKINLNFWYFSHTWLQKTRIISHDSHGLLFMILLWCFFAILELDSLESPFTFIIWIWADSWMFLLLCSTEEQVIQVWKHMSVSNWRLLCNFIISFYLNCPFKPSVIQTVWVLSWNSADPQLTSTSFSHLCFPTNTPPQLIFETWQFNFQRKPVCCLPLRFVTLDLLSGSFWLLCPLSRVPFKP